MESITRRSAVLSALIASGAVLSGCTGTMPPDGSGSARGSQPNAVPSPQADLAWEALLLSDPSMSSEDEPLSQMALDLLVKASNLAVWSDMVLVGAGGSLLLFDRSSGELAHTVALPAEAEGGPVGDAVSVSLDGDIVYVATSGGCIAAFDLPDGSQRWITSVCPVRSTGWLAGSVDLPGAWACTEVAVRDGAVAVGFSSFQMEYASTFACVAADTGAVRWSQQLEGRFDVANGIGYPRALEEGLLTPLPDGTGIRLFDLRTGEPLDRMETDSEVYMGLTLSASGGLPCYFQSRLGTLYKVWIESGALVAESADDACRGADLRIPSGARPLLVDGRIIVNAATQTEDALRFDSSYDPSTGAWMAFDTETLEPVGSWEYPEIESTPAVAGGVLYYLGRAGVYGAALANGEPAAPELLFAGEGRDVDVWEQQLLCADGMLFFVGGKNGERRLFALTL